MNEKELDFILQEGEGLKIEFKENFDSKGLSHEIVAFANTEGGRIFLGVDDKNKVKGIEISNKLKSQIQDLARNCDPAINIELSELGDILIINVEEGKEKPYSCSSGFYLRQGANSQKMRRSEIIDLISEQNSVKFDNVTSSLKEFDKDLVRKFLKSAGVDGEIDQSVLFNLGVTDEKGFLNNTGILFFTKHPKKSLINAYITCARYKGVEKVHVIDRKDLEEDLVTQVEQAVLFVKRNTRLEYEIKGLRRKEIPEYPVEAIREAILNAVMHRDYFERGANVQIDIFDDRLTVTNIGGLIKPLTKEKLGEIAVRRNPLIADLFHRIHFVEKMGSGIKRIREECEDHGNVDFEIETDGFFIAKFLLRKEIQVTPLVPPPVTPQVELTKLEQRIIAEIKKNSKVSRKDIAGDLGIGTDTVKEYIGKLRKKGVLRRIGETSAGHWEVVKNGE
jgi:ATP-dependent DNA helicase RecG